MIKGAGILFLTKDGKVLLLKRSPASDMPGTWCTPGGRVEEGETAMEAARREAIEEIGSHPRDTLTLHTRRISSEVAGVAAAPGADAESSTPLVPVPSLEADVDFTTFLQKVDETFEPTLDSEHTGFAWVPWNDPPEPLHPGTRVVLARLGMNELDVAKAMAVGELVSPQRYDNMTMFAIRITGTGTAFRALGKGEHVYRKPANYLTPEFLERCNGLPVILEHPEKATLNSKEFNDRIVGTVVLPYLRGDEVWGIARIYDDTTVKMMESEQFSTSPTVVFRDLSVNSKLALEDGSNLLIEGLPSLLDHIAICRKGVWDKGGEASGVLSVETRGDSTMTDEEQKAADAARKDAEEKEAAKAKADAEAGEKLDKILSCVDSLSSRMDSFEAKEKEKADAEAKEKADAEEAARKDGLPEQLKKDAEAAEAKEKADAEEKEKADAEEKEKLKADAVDLRAQLADLASKMPKQLSDEDYAAMASAQAKADSIYAAHSSKSPRPLDGETLLGYRRRMASQLKEHSPTWKGVDLSAIADEAAFTIAESQIYADAMQSARNPVDLPLGQLREIVSQDETGRRMVSFAGQPISWMDGFSAPRRRVSAISNKS